MTHNPLFLFACETFCPCYQRLGEENRKVIIMSKWIGCDVDCPSDALLDENTNHTLHGERCAIINEGAGGVCRTVTCREQYRYYSILRDLLCGSWSSAGDTSAAFAHRCVLRPSRGRGGPPLVAPRGLQILSCVQSVFHSFRPFLSKRLFSELSANAFGLINALPTRGFWQTYNSFAIRIGTIFRLSRYASSLLRLV